MKKIIPIILLVLSLAACGNNKEVTAVTEGISFNARCDFGGSRSECFVKAYGGGNLSCRFSSPESVAGLTADFDGSQITLTYKELTYPLSSPMPTENLAEIINRVVTSASGKAAETEDEKCTVNGTAGSYPYTLILSETGLPISLSVPALDFYAEFSDVTILTKQE